MLIRLETIKNSNQILLIDELQKYVGSLEELEFFLECTDINLEPIVEDGYIYYHVSKECLNKFLISE